MSEIRVLFPWPLGLQIRGDRTLRCLLPRSGWLAGSKAFSREDSHIAAFESIVSSLPEQGVSCLIPRVKTAILLRSSLSCLLFW
jgi:hypothetical protein